jgi:hypothetical protein
LAFVPRLCVPMPAQLPEECEHPVDTTFPDLLIGLAGGLILIAVQDRLKSRVITLGLAAVAIGAAFLMTHGGFKNLSIDIPAAPHVTGSTSELVRVASAAGIGLLVLVFARANAPVEAGSGEGISHPRVKPVFGRYFFRIVWGATLIVGTIMLAHGVGLLRVIITYMVVYISGMALAVFDGGLEGIKVGLAKAEDENKNVHPRVSKFANFVSIIYRLGMVVVVITIWAALGYLIYHGV